ncbi:MAG: FKBP-type peptidyl-prolyl cis-trans isomerase [Bacteroidota bacterium]
MKKQLLILFFLFIKIGINAQTGNNFVGHWKEVNGNYYGSSELNITKSGDVFIIERNDNDGFHKTTAKFEKGSLVGAQWIGQINYSKETDHIYFRDYELMRAKAAQPKANIAQAKHNTPLNTTDKALKAAKEKAIADSIIEYRKKQEPIERAKYLNKNKIVISPTPSGLYYIERVQGNGRRPIKGCKVKVNYTVKLLDGTVFETNDKEAAMKTGTYNAQRQYQPIEFPVGLGQVISGWDEAILSNMSIGTKAQLIIPSNIAYGAQGGGLIKPYSTVNCDIELVDFSCIAVEPNTSNNTNQKQLSTQNTYPHYLIDFHGTWDAYNISYGANNQKIVEKEPSKKFDIGFENDKIKIRTCEPNAKEGYYYFAELKNQKLFCIGYAASRFYKYQIPSFEKLPNGELLYSDGIGDCILKPNVGSFDIIERKYSLLNPINND